MENASKALIIAGTLLLTLMVLSVLVYVFITYSQYSYEYDQKKETEALVQNNTKFTKYMGQTLTAQDVLTIANLTNEYNKKYDYRHIDLYLKENSTYKNIFNIINYENTSNNDWKSFLTNNSGNTYIIEDSGIVYNNDGTIREIYINKRN